MTTLANERDRVLSAWQLFHHRWLTARERWVDQQARTFQKTYVDSFEKNALAVVGALDRLVELIAAAEHSVH